MVVWLCWWAMCGVVLWDVVAKWILCEVVFRNEVVDRVVCGFVIGFAMRLPME